MHFDLILLTLSLWIAAAPGAESTRSIDSPTPAEIAEEPLDPEHAAKMTAGLELFKSKVRPILIKHCHSCHGGEATENELDISMRDLLLKGGTSGAAVVKGKPDDSLLIHLVRHDHEPKMPMEADKLSDEAIADIARWIELGAPYDGSLLVADSAKDWTKRIVPLEAKEFWSFQPLSKPVPPAVQDETRCRTPVDRFLLAKLEAAGIEPNPAVNREQLLRRVTLDLIGLPPTPAEIAAFADDTSLDALDRVLDRLLRSHQHGERWGRHWLDVVRFGESHGFEHDYDRPTAYHYRDFVIKALSQDMPFDQFVKWQLAGDELAPENPLALMATGFLGAGVHSTQITKNEVEKHRYDEMDDMLATVGTSMLGLTIGCARCHDHKYDPIPQRDYYQLLATFTTTIRGEMEVELDPEPYQRAKAAYDREHEPELAAIRTFETEVLPGRLANWEQNRSAGDAIANWQTVLPTSSVSQGGATFQPQADDSLLVSGTNAKFDTYTFVVHTSLSGIMGLRIEALADPSLVKGGPGRAANGNFDLTDVQVFAASTATPESVAKIKLLSPQATFEQKGLPIAATLDDQEKSGWAVDPEFGKNHAAAYRIELPIGYPGGTILTVTLQFQGNDGHNIGRPRLSLATSPEALDAAAPGMSARAAAALAKPSIDRSAEEQVAVLHWFKTTDPDWQRLDAIERAHRAKEPQRTLTKILVTGEGVKPMRLHSQGDDFFQETHFLRRGETNNKSGVANQSFLQVLMPAPDTIVGWTQKPPEGSAKSWRRTSLANWLTDSENGAGHLLARVIVNRLWHHHMGRGIVTTPSDFGHRGEVPTHPELLDWLAGELIANGWKLRPIHKLILKSAAYAACSTQVPEKVAKDDTNRLYWRWNPRRLEGEVIRDSALAVSGQLDPTPFGPGTLDEATTRRSIYFTVKRSQLVPMMQVFDGPDALTGIADRDTTTIAPQALLLLNNTNVRKQAHAFAKRVRAAPSSDKDAIAQAYLLALGRKPTADELDSTSVFLVQQRRSYEEDGKDDAGVLAMTDLCQAILCLNEFAYVE